MAISYSISFTFSPSTTISSSQVNTNFSDNANTWNGLEAKTKTFSNLGVDTQLKSGGTVESANGTAGAPSITFSADTATGFFRSGSGVIGVGTSNKITGLAVATAATDAVAFSQLKVLQVVAATTVTVKTTTSSTFQATSLTVNITPTSASNRILIMATGCLATTAANIAAYATLARGGSNLLGVSGGATTDFSQSVTVFQTPASLCFVDSPASTSLLTYAVYLTNSDNATTVQWGATNLTQSIVVMEVV